MSTTKEFVGCFYAVSGSTFQLAGDSFGTARTLLHTHARVPTFFLASACLLLLSLLFDAAKVNTGALPLVLHYLISPFSHKLSCFFFIQMGPRISHLLPSSGVLLGESSTCTASMEELLEGAGDSEAWMMGCFLKTLPLEDSTSFAGTWKAWIC